MSTQTQRTTAPRVAPPRMSLASQLKAAGVAVLDAERVADMMLATEYGKDPYTARPDIEADIANGAVPHYVWEVYDYDTYCADPSNIDLGGAPPRQIQGKVTAARDAIPGLEVYLHCVPEDPFVEARLGDERCWIGWWSFVYRDQIA